MDRTQPLPDGRGSEELSRSDRNALPHGRASETNTD
jgi:hypothetical protein